MCYIVYINEVKNNIIDNFSVNLMYDLLFLYKIYCI